MQATRSSWSSLEISTIVVDRICPRESAECVGKQGAYSEGVKGERYSKLSPELKAEIDRQAVEHGLDATVRLYAKRLLGDGCG